MKYESTLSPASWYRPAPGFCLAVLVMVSVGAHGQSEISSVAVSGSRHLFTIEPRISVSEIITSNVGLSSTNARSEQITEVSPGIRMVGDGGRVKGFFDYTLTGVAYAQGSAANNRRQALNAAGTVVAVENRLFLDLSGVISQQAVSAFGIQSVDGALGSRNPNLSETSSFRLSPYFRGQLGEFASYEARYGLATTRTASAAASDVTTKDVSLQLGSGSSFRRLGWSVVASRTETNFDAGRVTQADQLRASVSFAVNPQFSLTATGMQESTNLTGAVKESSRSGGWGANWSPSERTKLSFLRQNRFFGESHSLNLEHRTGRTAWSLTDSRDVYSASNQATVASLGTVYDLFFSQFAAVEPDPLKRAELVNAFLQANGINPGGTVSRGFLTSAVSVQRRQALSVALLGLRDTVTFLASRSLSSRLDTARASSDDFASSDHVRQMGLSINYAHRLTPHTSFNLMVSKQDSSGSGGLQDTSLRSLLFNLSTRLGRQTSAALGFRRVVFESRTAPYDESAITGTLSMQF